MTERDESIEMKIFTCVDPWAEETVPEEARSAAMDGDGTVYVPAVWFGCQGCVARRAALDEVPVLADDRYRFVPAWWAAATFPDWDEVLRAYVAKIRKLDEDISRGHVTK
jgi:hypothetical protein